MSIDDRSVKIGIVGGAGQMGRWLRGFWEARGNQVLWSDRETALVNEDVVEASDITFVAVPLGITPTLIRSLVPRISEHRCLVSIASLMQPSARELGAVRGESLCAHPIFGPNARRTADLPVVVAAVRGDHWRRWLVDSLRTAGMHVRETSPEQHDASMAVVQALLHSLFVALCGAMTAAGLPPELALDWASPTLRLQLGLAARILGQDPALYADLVVGNPLAPDRLDALAGELKRLADYARDGNTNAFMQAFREARGSFGHSLDVLASQAETALEDLT